MSVKSTEKGGAKEVLRAILTSVSCVVLFTVALPSTDALQSCITWAAPSRHNKLMTLQHIGLVSYLT